MSGSRPAHAASSKRLWWWIGGGAVIVLAVAVAAVALGGGSPAAPASASPTPAGSSPAATESVPASPSASTEPSASPTTASPSPSPTRPVKKVSYCKAWKEITTSSVQSSSDDGSVDFNDLADLFSSLIKSYSSAAKAAPSSLDGEYAVVLAYLKDMRKAVVAKDLDGIKDMVANLELLNEHMATIQKASKKICG